MRVSRGWSASFCSGTSTTDVAAVVRLDKNFILGRQRFMMESGQKVRHDTFVLPYQILQLQKSSDKRFLIGLTTQSGILESVPKSFLVS